MMNWMGSPIAAGSLTKAVRNASWRLQYLFNCPTQAIKVERTECG